MDLNADPNVPSPELKQSEPVRRICLRLVEVIVDGMRTIGWPATGEMIGTFVVITIDDVEVTFVDSSWVFGPDESAERFRGSVEGLTTQVLDAVQTSMRAQGYLDWPCAPGGPSLVAFAHDAGRSLIGYFGPSSHDGSARLAPGLIVVIVDVEWDELVRPSRSGPPV